LFEVNNPITDFFNESSRISLYSVFSDSICEGYQIVNCFVSPAKRIDIVMDIVFPALITFRVHHIHQVLKKSYYSFSGLKFSTILRICPI
jgi:hypothetical protein